MRNYAEPLLKPFLSATSLIAFGYVLLVGIAAFPFLEVHHPPLLDYPNHLARMHILLNRDDAQLMLRQDSPNDHVVARGRSTSVREMCRIAFECIGREAEKHIQADPQLYRPAEIDVLPGNLCAGPGSRCRHWPAPVSELLARHGIIVASLSPRLVRLLPP